MFVFVRKINGRLDSGKPKIVNANIVEKSTDEVNVMCVCDADPDFFLKFDLAKLKDGDENSDSMTKVADGLYLAVSALSGSFAIELSSISQYWHEQIPGVFCLQLRFDSEVLPAFWLEVNLNIEF